MPSEPSRTAKGASHGTIPRVDHRDPSLTAIDCFVEQKLRASGLTASPRASREVLARRLYLDLIGLPPSPDQIDDFLADRSPQSYVRLVDRLLASPRFGERWGRHWLDVVRYAESLTLRGFVFSEAWRYRDLVIQCFNEDVPFDHYVYYRNLLAEVIGKK